MCVIMEQETTLALGNYSQAWHHIPAFGANSVARSSQELVDHCHVFPQLSDPIVRVGVAAPSPSRGISPNGSIGRQECLGM